MLGRLLELDPSLGRDLDPVRHAAALRSVRGFTFELDRGPWPGIASQPGHLGALVVEGMLAREVRVAGGRSCEVLGPGDVLRPWDDDADDAPVPSLAGWKVLEPVTLMALDRSVAIALAPYPEITAELMGRLAARQRWLACLLAVADIPRVDIRLLVALWHLADRWGTVDAGGVCVPLRLTHGTLGALIGARRPSVTRSLGTLVRRGLVIPRADGGWHLPVEASEALARVQLDRDGAVTRMTAPRAQAAAAG